MSEENTHPTRAERLNTALYQKMFAAQEMYRAWLLSQPPEEILNHTYEYTMREDILMSLEFNELGAAQANAMLALRDPLDTLFREYDRTETNHMDDIWNVFEQCAAQEREKLRGRQTGLER